MSFWRKSDVEIANTASSHKLIIKKGLPKYLQPFFYFIIFLIKTDGDNISSKFRLYPPKYYNL